jgi:hypothetical protein
MADPLADRFPTLFFDIQMVEQRNAKPVPSLVEVVTAILKANGMTNNAPGAATDVVNAIQQYNARSTPGK